MILNHKRHVYCIGWKKNQIMRKLLFLVAMLATTAILFGSCSKDKDEVKVGSKVQYRLTGSSNVTLITISITDGNGQISSVAAPSSNTWTSEEFTLTKKNMTLQLAGGGLISSGTGELKAEILIDGKVVKESNNSDNTTSIAAVVYHQF